MKTKDGDLYMLADGTYADPKDCKAGDGGVLRHTNGVPVAMKADGEPMTMSRVTEHNEAVKAASEADAAPVDGAEKA